MNEYVSHSHRVKEQVITRINAQKKLELSVSAFSVRGYEWHVGEHNWNLHSQSASNKTNIYVEYQIP